MPIGREDFEACDDGDVLSGVFQFGDLVHRVFQSLPEHHALMESEIVAQANLTAKESNYVNDALAKLVELGRIRKKQIGGADRYQKEASPTIQQWYTINEAANYLRVSRRTIYQLLQEGQLASDRVGRAGHRRFKREDLDLVMQKEEGEELYAMSEIADPVLAELWDNEKDAEYDQI